MARPRRAAADKARQLFQVGYGSDEGSEEEINWYSSSEDDFSKDSSIFEDEVSENSSEDGVTDATECFVGTSGGGDCPQAASMDCGVDVTPNIKDFRPTRPPGPHIGDRCTREDVTRFTSPQDFFSLYFTEDLLMTLCDNTNKYAWLHVGKKKSYATQKGGWSDLTLEELKTFIALIVFMGLESRPDWTRYWSTATLYSGCWARRFMSRTRGKALMAMFHVSDPDMEEKADKLTKVRMLINHMKAKCISLYQPHRMLSVDERMVPSKGRSGITQFIPTKPIRFGIKVWCLCEAHTGYTVNFDFYTGKCKNPSKMGQGYDVVTMLLGPFSNQNYEAYFDNFFTSLVLVTALRDMGVYACGTTVRTRRGFPKELKDTKWEKKAKRGDSRYIRKEGVLFQQWKDTKPVTICSSFHSGDKTVDVQRKSKDADGNHCVVTIQKPAAIDSYNRGMGGVDLSDQLIGSYSVQQKCRRWWKKIFFHCIDIAILNSYILFCQWQCAHPEIEALQRPPGYGQLEYREELVRQLSHIDGSEDIPVYTRSTKTGVLFDPLLVHVPKYTDRRHNCRVCYVRDRKQRKTKWKCRNSYCDVYLCIKGKRNCFEVWHSNEFAEYR